MGAASEQREWRPARQGPGVFREDTVLWLYCSLLAVLLCIGIFIFVGEHNQKALKKEYLQKVNTQI